MNCHDARSLIGAEPHSQDPQLLAHVAQCAECARYRQELQSMDRLVAAALQVGVPRATAPRRRAWKQPVWGLAASLLVAGAAALFWLLNPRETLAQQVVEHLYHEPHALVSTSQQVEAAELAAILSRAGLRLKPGTAHVSYAMNCWFRGHFIPHLVVQSAHGPVTVLVIPREATSGQVERIEENGFQGLVMPAPRGVLVVIGHNTQVAAVGRSVLNALEYTG